MAAAGRNGVSRIVQRKIDLQLVAWVGYWICLVILFVLLRAKSSNLVFIDETIPIKISQAMTARGNLDPNWRSADLPEELRYDQYNFYLYNVVAHFVIKVAGWLGRSGLGELRHANLLFQLLALAFAVDALRRIGAGLLALAAAGALITFAPGMVQDAGMARPESLLYLFSALFVWTLTLPLAERRRLLLAGVVLGAGIAVKLTFVSLAVMLPFLAPVRGRPVTELAASAAIFALGAALGFAAGAPYTIIHFDVYRHGLAMLAAQYGSAHPPHSLPEYGVGSQVLWLGRYFIELYGLALIAALASPFMLKGLARNWALALVGAWVVLCVYFASKPVFFERNFAHGLVPLLLAAALGLGAFKRTSWQVTVAVLVALPMAYWSVQIASILRETKRLERFEAAHALAPAQLISFETIHAGELPARCERVIVLNANDPWSAAYLAKLEQNSFTPIALYRSPFGPLVTSTLHTYIDGDLHYFRCP